jgi:hypothetical protein
VIIVLAIVVGTEEVLQTSSEGIKQTIQSSSPNIKDEEWVHIENNSNLRTPLLTIPAFGTLEWIIEEGWLILSKRKESNKQTPKVSENSKSRNITDHNLSG